MSFALPRALRHAPRCTALLILMAQLVGRISATEPEVASTEVRKFNISVDGDKCGTFLMTIQSQPDGRHTVSGDAALEMKYLVYKFRYTSKGTEVWNANKLERLESLAHYGGSKYQVTALSKGDEILVKANKKEHKLPANVWVTSYWREPQPDNDEQNVTLLDADKGHPLKAKLQRLGKRLVSVSGTERQCNHYRLSGEVDVQLWYDDQGRLARQETVASGHHTRLDLTEIIR
jgi:hypothetical protein